VRARTIQLIKENSMIHKLRLFVLPIIVAFALSLAVSPASAQYKQTNLVADQAGITRHSDPYLINSWGMVAFGDDGFMLADSFAGVATFYDCHGNTLRPPLTIPATPNSGSGAPGLPAGLIYNPTSEFVISANGKSAPARYIFANLDGTIQGWNPDVDPNPIIVVDNSAESPFPASYSGLTMGRNINGEHVIYAADGGNSIDQSNNQIDVFDGKFNSVGHFGDPDSPAGMTVYGVFNVEGRIYVTFSAFTSLAGGAVDVFDNEGNLIRRFATNGPEGPLQSPWQVLRAPDDFGPFSRALLIGGVDDGHINAFDPHTAAFLGVFKDVHGNPITIEAIWSLVFARDDHGDRGDRRDRDEVDRGGKLRLYFCAGPTFPPNTIAYSDGLFGFISVAQDGDDDEPPVPRSGAHHRPRIHSKDDH
jgi:uncharacterized protein (TIGR03118 family)